MYLCHPLHASKKGKREMPASDITTAQGNNVWLHAPLQVR
jgi:hypothetical protein